MVDPSDSTDPPDHRVDERKSVADSEGSVTDRGAPNGGRRIGRRTFVSLVTGAATTTLAGCSNNDTAGTTAGQRPDGVANAVSVMTGAIPTSLDMGPNLGPVAGRLHFEGFLHSLVLPRHGPTGDRLTSGHTWRVDGSELSVPCAVQSYEVVDGATVRLQFDDRLTYWNGEPLDARAYHHRDRILWLEDDGALREESFDGELISATEYLWSPVAEPTNTIAARSDVHPGMPPLPPSYSLEWIERFEDATTEAKVQQASLDFRQGKLSIEEFVEAGYGTGRYEVPSADDVTTELIELPHSLRSNFEVVYLEPRAAYPGPTDRPPLRILGGVTGVGTPQIRSRTGDDRSGTFYDPRDVVAGGEADIGTGVIGDGLGEFHREQVPGRIEQLQTWPNPASGGVQLTFNWDNEHLRRLWVRRALVAAAPLERTRRNAYGSGTAPVSAQSGMLGRTDVSAFGTAFVDSLYDYPLAADHDIAASWLRTAGYERADGLWRAPNGDSLALTLCVFAPNVQQVQTLASGLEAFGVAVDVRQLLGKETEYQDVVSGGGFDLLLTRVPGGYDPTAFYGDWFAVGSGWAATPPIAVVGNPFETCRDGQTTASVPDSVTLPSDPGALAVDGVEYPDGGSKYEWDTAGETVALCEEVQRLRAEGTDESRFYEAARRCARWYNYALPSVVFVRDRAALWANRRQLTVATADERSTAMGRGEPTAPLHYHVQAGTLRRASD